MKTLTYIILAFVLSECRREYKELRFSDKNQENQVYSLINDYLIDSLYHPDLISIEAMGHYNSKVEKNGDVRPPGYYYSYGNMLFDSLIELRIIDSIDIISFKKQMSEPYKLSWDPKRLKVSTFSRDTLFGKRVQDINFDIYEYLKQKYDARSFLIVSIPLFSEDYSIIIISTLFACGWTCAEEVEYVFKRTNKIWKIVYSNRIGVS